MSITEYQRNQLFNWFEEHMGKERADTMMSLLPPVGWGDVATKRDLDAHAVATKRDLDAHAVATKRDLDAHAATTKHALETLEQRVDARFEHVDTKFDLLDERIERMGSDLRAAMAEGHAQLQRTFVTWLLTAQAAVVGLVGLMFAFVH